MTNLDINVQKVSRAKSQVESAQKKLHQIRELLVYLRNDHVGMIRGDGELTRYLSYLTRIGAESIDAANVNLENSGAPDELPF